MNRHIIIGVITAVILLVMVPVVMAQQFTPPSPESRVKQIEEAVKLTPEQSAQILKIYTDAQQSGGGRGGFAGGATAEAVEKVLTPEQVKQLRAYTLKRSVDRRITQIDEAVTLTAEQKKKIIPIIEKEINAQNDMMAEMRSQGQNADRESMMAKMTAIREATDKALETILTKDQLQKYNAMPRRGMGMRNR